MFGRKKGIIIIIFGRKKVAKKLARHAPETRMLQKAELYLRLKQELESKKPQQNWGKYAH